MDKKLKEKRKEKNTTMNSTIEVVTAHKIDDELFEQLIEIFNLDRERIVKKLDPSILGGVIIRKGSELYDGSVRSKLENLKLTLHNKLHTS